MSVRDQKRFNRAKDMEKGIEYLHMAANKFNNAGDYVREASIDILIQRAEESHEIYMAENFPTVEMKDANRN